MDAAAVAALFASAARAPRRPQPGRPRARRPQPQRPQAYARPGDPRGLVLTAKQWADYDEHMALCDRMERKYGHLRGMAAMMNMTRVIL